MVLLVHATLQWHNIGEKQSKFLMLGDILCRGTSIHQRLRCPPIASTSSARCLLLTGTLISRLGPWKGEQKQRRGAFIQRALVS